MGAVFLGDFDIGWLAPRCLVRGISLLSFHLLIVWL